MYNLIKDLQINTSQSIGKSIATALCIGHGLCQMKFVLININIIMFTGHSIKGKLPPLASGSRTFRKILALLSNAAFCRNSVLKDTRIS